MVPPRMSIMSRLKPSRCQGISLGMLSASDAMGVACLRGERGAMCRTANPSPRTGQLVQLDVCCRAPARAVACPRADSLNRAELQAVPCGPGDAPAPRCCRACHAERSHVVVVGILAAVSVLWLVASIASMPQRASRACSRRCPAPAPAAPPDTGLAPGLGPAIVVGGRPTLTKKDRPTPGRGRRQGLILKT